MFCRTALDIYNIHECVTKIYIRKAHLQRKGHGNISPHRITPRQIHINTNTIMCIHRTQYVVEKFNFVKRRTHSAHFLALVFMYSCVRVWQRTAT